MVRSGCNAPPVVNVWACICDYSGSIEKFACALSAGEYEQAQRFVRRQNSARGHFGRTLIRQSLCSLVRHSTRDTEHRTHCEGKTVLAREKHNCPGARIDLNIAHSGDCVLIAWSVGRISWRRRRGHPAARNLPFSGSPKPPFPITQCWCRCCGPARARPSTFCAGSRSGRRRDIKSGKRTAASSPEICGPFRRHPEIQAG